MRCVSCSQADPTGWVRKCLLCQHSILCFLRRTDSTKGLNGAETSDKLGRAREKCLETAETCHLMLFAIATRGGPYSTIRVDSNVCSRVRCPR